MPTNKPDLTLHPPRSARVQLGGYVTLPRILDKCRATLAGKNGDYRYACPLDQRWLTFAGIDPDALKEQVAADKSDGEILRWITESSSTKPDALAIAAWSAQAERRVPTDVETRAFFNDLHAKTAPQREDIATWFDVLDLDDYVSFGGKA